MKLGGGSDRGKSNLHTRPEAGSAPCYRFASLRGAEALSAETMRLRFENDVSLNCGFAEPQESSQPSRVVDLLVPAPNRSHVMRNPRRSAMLVL